jgi:hypothetical protein
MRAIEALKVAAERYVHADEVDWGLNGMDEWCALSIPHCCAPH